MALPYDISDECLLLAVVGFYWDAWYPVRVNINGLDLKKFTPPAVKPPTVKELGDIATSFGFVCSDEDLEHYKNHITKALGGYQDVNDLVAPTLPVNYPRTPGYKPEPEDNKLNAWYWRCDIQGAPGGPLKGKTVAIKDNICVAGVPMANGSKIMEGFVPDIDAVVVTRILDAGGHIVGKTNCEHMCFSGNSFTNDTGPTLNPVDPSRTTGGSSGGSAAAVRCGDVDLALGGDQGGSVRIPSSWCGIVGLKPTFGLVPYTGAVPIEITVDHLGPMAKTVSDCALLLETIAGYDGGRDPRQPRDIKVPEFSKLLDVDVSGKKVCLLQEGFDWCEEDVQKVVREAANKLKSVGVTLEDVSMPLHKKAVGIWAPICTDGAYQCMVRGYGNGYHYKGYYAESISAKLRESYATNARNVSEPLMMVAMLGSFMEKNYGGRYYGRAQNLNMKLTQAYEDLMETYDVIIMPTMTYKAPVLPTKNSNVGERLEHALAMVKNTAPFNITGHPALTINAGMVDGLPIGMTIVGKQFDDLTVLQMARAFEKLQ